MPIEDPYAMPPEFVFPKNLKEMSEEAKEDLHRNHLLHTTNAHYCEASPSKVLDPDSTEYKAKVYLKKMNYYHYPVGHSPNFEFDPVKGYIVPEEDLTKVHRLGDVSPEDMARLMKKGPKPISDKDLDRAKMAVLSPVEREVEERFSDI